ncbi:MAG: SpoIID/LytB domain-containing protein [Clostridia bacterium]|nr:SpoIID/LytB domain-containing protein [Clostridia bacterium]
MSKRNKTMLALLLAAALLCAGCRAQTPEQPMQTDAPAGQAGGFVLPDTIRVNAEGVPQLRVYVTDAEQVRDMDLEEYLCGVLAGEMKNDWPLEALKAQAILARTFVIKFITEKESLYEGADISTDIREAQAYDAAGVNDRVREAVEATRGLVVCYGQEPIYAWFHAHSGGRTATAAEGLSYKDAAPYTQSVAGGEGGDAPKDAAEWEARFTAEEVRRAAKEAGVDVGGTVESVEAGARGESGRVQRLIVNGKEVPANEFRVAIGSADMKSTLLTEVAFSDGELLLRGKGYGHGVGMPQWGAYTMAEDGKDAQSIIHTYFRDVEIVQMWK